MVFSELKIRFAMSINTEFDSGALNADVYEFDIRRRRQANYIQASLLVIIGRLSTRPV